MMLNAIWKKTNKQTNKIIPKKTRNSEFFNDYQNSIV